MRRAAVLPALAAVALVSAPRAAAVRLGHGVARSQPEAADEDSGQRPSRRKAARALAPQAPPLDIATGFQRETYDRRDAEQVKHFSCEPDRHALEPEAPRLELTRTETRPRDAEQSEWQQVEANLTHLRTCREATDTTSFLQPLVLPEYKLAFCYIPKVACTQFKDLFNAINGKTTGTQGFARGYGASMMRKFQLTSQDVSPWNGWKFATFTRDPALRYLSAFGSTCVSNKAGRFEHPKECCGNKHSNLAPMKEQVKFFSNRSLSDLQHGLVRNEDHWTQQNVILRQCGWSRFNPNKLDFWGGLSGDVNQQVKAMLAMVGYLNDTLVDRLFPSDRIAGHTNPMPGSPAEYMDIKTLHAIVKLHEDDYQELKGVGCSFTEPLFKQLTAGKKDLSNSSMVKSIKTILRRR